MAKTDSTSFQSFSRVVVRARRRLSQLPQVSIEEGERVWPFCRTSFSGFGLKFRLRPPLLHCLVNSRHFQRQARELPWSELQQRRHCYRKYRMPFIELKDET